MKHKRMYSLFWRPRNATSGAPTNRRWTRAYPGSFSRPAAIRIFQNVLIGAALGRPDIQVELRPVAPGQEHVPLSACTVFPPAPGTARREDA